MAGVVWSQISPKIAKKNQEGKCQTKKHPWEIRENCDKSLKMETETMKLQKRREGNKRMGVLTVRKRTTEERKTKQ